MSWLLAPLLVLGALALAGPASAAATYVPEFLDGIYTHPYFLDVPAVKDVKIESEDANMPKPIIVDEPLPPKKLPAKIAFLSPARVRSSPVAPRVRSSRAAPRIRSSARVAATARGLRAAQAT